MSILHILGPATPFSYVVLAIVGTDEPIRLLYAVPHAVSFLYDMDGDS